MSYLITKYVLNASNGTAESKRGSFIHMNNQAQLTCVMVVMKHSRDV